MSDSGTTAPSLFPSWKAQLSASITDADTLARHFGMDLAPLKPVIRNFPMRISPYYLSLIRFPGDPLWRQAVPDPLEMTDEFGTPDPLEEENSSPVPGLIHRYPDRAVLLVASGCALFCRFCMRKRRAGLELAGSSINAEIDTGIDYIRQTPAIHEVVLSGGDPLILDDMPLSGILQRLRAVAHVQRLRIHSRTPCTLPHRITDDLVRILREMQPLYLNIHFNHPDEITPHVRDACARLADAGIPLGSQTVLLSGVNDAPEILHQLMEMLLTMRVRPYYLHQLDRVSGTAHFRVPLEKGIAIMNHLRGRLSGMGVPHYMVDLPGGGGKIPLIPEYCINRGADTLVFRNFEGRRFRYPLR